MNKIIVIFSVVFASLEANQVIEGTLENFKEEVVNASLPVVVEFYKKKCPPCIRLAPILSELSNEMGEYVKFVKVDVMMQKELTRIYKVSSMPTLFFIKEGKIYGRRIGFLEKKELAEKITTLLIEG